jgi:PAS domain S-box-containing protein
METKKPKEGWIEALKLNQTHIYAMDLAGKIIFWNRGAEQLYGWTEEQAMGKQAHILLMTELHLKIKDFIAKILKAYVWTGELIQYNRDGSKIIVSSNAILHRDDVGKPDGIIVVNNDMTKLKRTEEALIQSEEKFKIIATNTPDHILIQDKDLRYTVVINPKLGLGEKDMLGKTDDEIFNEENAKTLMKIKKKVMVSDKSSYVNLPLVSLKGDTQYFEGSYVPKHDIKGKVNGLIGYLKNVTIRKNTEAELASRRQELQTIIDSVPAAIFYKDVENHYLRVNKALTKIMDMPKDKLEGKSLFDIYPEKQARDSWMADLDVIKKGRPRTNVIEPMHTSRGDLWVQTDRIPYYDPAGNIIGVIGFSIDITARKSADEKIKRFNRTLRVISSANQLLMHAKGEQEFLDRVNAIIVKGRGYMFSWIGFVDTDKEKSVRPVAMAGFNEGYLEKLNIKSGNADKDLYPTSIAIRTGRIAVCRNVLTDHNFKPWSEEARNRGYASIVALPLRSEGSTYGAITLYSPDPDPFSDAEIKLLEELAFDLSYGIMMIRIRGINREAEKIINKVAAFPYLDPNPISEIDTSGKIHYMNPAFQKMFTGAEKEPLEHQWFKGISSFFWAFKGKKEKIISRDIQVQDRYFLQTMVYMPIEETIRTYGIDITERKKAEDELIRLNTEMENKVQQRTSELFASKHLADIGTLAATVAHELRNPLGVINVAVYNLRKKMPEKSNDMLQHLTNIEKKVAESGQIINNLLVFAKMKMPLFEKTDIYKLVEECVVTVKKRFGGKKIAIKTGLTSIKGLLVEADALQIKEVFTNIITNAFQAIENKTGKVTVTAVLKTGNMVAVSVKDSGGGISKDDMDNIYKPFFTRKTKGTGLGLVICRDLVNMHNGSIEIKSKSGKGSTFTVNLPIRRL